MTEDDDMLEQWQLDEYAAEMESNIASSVAKLCSMSLFGDSVTRMYALLWCAAQAAREVGEGGEELFHEASLETVHQFPWGE